MTLVFQKPGNADLLTAINNAALNANSGGGVFAFASKGGIDELFALPNISHMLNRGGSFNLVVGIDAITNAEALLCLGDKVAQIAGALTGEVFYHEHPCSTFHPKFSWFNHGNDLFLITGSGNLTLRGLGQVAAVIPPAGNWEAFSVQVLNGEEAEVVRQTIEDWLVDRRRVGALRLHDDDDVRNRAIANGLVRFKRGPALRAPGAVAAAVDVVPLDNVDFGSPEILVRELPKNRPGQADVGRAALTEFFGYGGVAIDVFIQHISLANVVGPVDAIRLFVNRSQNYRLELRAMVDLGYDVAGDDGRMILVASKLDRRSFRYSIVPVIDGENYPPLTDLLGNIPAGKRKMREARITPEQLQMAWKNVPEDLLPVKLLTPEP